MNQQQISNKSVFCKNQILNFPSQINKMNESGSKNKSNIPSCSVCKNQYDSYYRIPRVMPKCGHTFCQKCINSTLQVKANRKLFICTQCQSQTVIRKGAAEDIPKNIGILDIVKSLKKQQIDQSSPLRHHQSPKQSPSKQKATCKQHVNKQLDLICQTCNHQKVCSICVLIGNNHQDHKFVQYISASKVDLNEVKQVFTIIQDSVHQTILPQSEHNILKKAEENLINQLIISVRSCFKELYYKVIEKKQAQIIAQCKQIKFEGGISKKIQEIAKNYDLLKIQFSSIFSHSAHKESAPLQIVEQFIQRCKNLHNQIEVFSEHAEKQSKMLYTDISTKISQSSFFRMVEIPFSLKNILGQKIDGISPAQNRAQSNTLQIRKNKNNVQFDLKESRSSQKPQLKNQDDAKSIDNMSFEGQRKPFTANSINSKNKSAFLPPKHKINKLEPKQQSREQELIPLLNLNSRINDKKTSTSQNKLTSNTQRLKKSSFQNLAQQKRSVQKIPSKLNMSHIMKLQGTNQQGVDVHLKIKQVRPSKQIPLNLKAKYSAIVKQITRQVQSQNLQLIGMEINDALIVYICEYLKTKRLKYSMIKLVKNNLTDEGLSILFGHLINDDRTQVLNLTSNQLTHKSLDLIIDLANKNNFLKTIYLSHNKVSSFNMKPKSKDIQASGIQIII